MSYAGTTAATPNPPTAISQPLTRGTTATGLGFTSNKPSLWFYSSTNLTTDMTASNFFSDAFYIGMRQGDVVMGAQYTSANSSGIAFVGVVGAVTTAGAALSTGGTMTSTFN
jgi:hypothetical protein